MRSPSSPASLPPSLPSQLTPSCSAADPYPSNYLTGGRAILPAFPLRRACDSLAADFGSNEDALLEALSTATLIVNNASKAEACVNLPTADADDGQDCVLCALIAIYPCS